MSKGIEAESSFTRLFRASPAPFLVLEPDAPRFTIRDANDAYLTATMRTREAVVGHGIFEAFPDNPEIATFSGSNCLRTALEHVLSSRRPNELTDLRYDVACADGTFEERWWSPVNSPVLDEDGEVEVIIHNANDVTEKRRAEAARCASDARHAFLLALNDTLRPIVDPADVKQAAMRSLGVYLSANRVTYFETDGADFVVQGGYAVGVADIAGRHPIQSFGQKLHESFRSGQVASSPDTDADLNLSSVERAEFAKVNVRAYVGAPLVKGGEFVAGLAVHSVTPRSWTVDEIALVQDVAERTWAAVERARAEAALRQSETLLSAVLDALPVGVILADAQGRVTRTNAANHKLWGMPPEMTGFEQYGEWVGWWPATGERIEGTDWAMARALLHGETVTNELIENQRFGTGERRFILNNAAPVRDASGAIVAGVVAQMDVTERLAAERELIHLNETLEQRIVERTADRDRLWQSSQDLLMVARFDGTIVTVNPAWATALGWTQAEMISMYFWTLIHPDDVAACQVHATALSTEGQTSARFECRYRSKSGDWHWLAWSATSSAGLFNGVARDVTEDRRRQAELELVQNALRQSQKMEAMGVLTGGVAHDFNNLLTPILGLLDMLQRKGLGNEREQRLIAGALQSADRAKTLVQRLLAFARRQPLQTTSVNLGPLVRGMADLISSTIGPQIKVVLDALEDLPPAKADPNQLEMAILNLAVNARDAMPEGGTLRITIEAETVEREHRSNVTPGQYLLLSVADTGSGMDESTLRRAVEPFFSTKGVGKGTGLGLSMVHGLASQLGGAVTIQSTPGLGTNIELWLPQSAEPFVETRTDGHVAKISTAGSGIALLVDDEDLVRLSTADMLIDLGYTVVEAASADEALKLVNRGLQPDVLVTDHLMPGMTGTELARLLQGSRPGIRVLVVSGYAEAEGVAPDLPRLTKPFRSVDLAASLAALG